MTKKAGDLWMMRRAVSPRYRPAVSFSNPWSPGREDSRSSSMSSSSCGSTSEWKPGHSMFTTISGVRGRYLGFHFEMFLVCST